MPPPVLHNTAACCCSHGLESADVGFTHEHVQLGYQLVVTAVLSVVRVVELKEAEVTAAENIVLVVLIGLVVSLSGHQDPPVPKSPDHIRTIRGLTRQADMVILRDRKVDT